MPNTTEGRHLVTGASGLIGSHLVEQLVCQGTPVRALVRPTSDRRFLERLGVELVVGDLQDISSLRAAVRGVEIVYHCAARVSDWGPWEWFQRDIVTATQNLLEVCRAVGINRLVHVSSIAVYGRPRTTAPITEDAPLGQRLRRWDYYGRAKIAAEQLVRRFVPTAVILRPVWTYGPRDRASVPRLFAALRAGRVPLLGSGRNLLNILYAGDVAMAAVRAAVTPGAAGQAYNLSSPGEITQQELLAVLTKALGAPPVRRRLPLWLARGTAGLLEAWARLWRWPEPPTLTCKVVDLVSRTTRYSADKARRELGWEPRVDIQEGVRRTLEWYFGPDGPGSQTSPRGNHAAFSPAGNKAGGST